MSNPNEWKLISMAKPPNFIWIILKDIYKEYHLFRIVDVEDFNVFCRDKQIIYWKFVE
jgi:hypothetical protein